MFDFSSLHCNANAKALQIATEIIYARREIEFLYARLQTGRIMVWWCPSVQVSVRQSQFSALFSCMLWHIELKFCMSLSSYEHSIKFECRQFPSIFCWSYAPFGTSYTGNTQFSAFFSYMLWHIGPKFCIWLCFTVLQIKFHLSFVNLHQFLWELCPF